MHKKNKVIFLASMVIVTIVLYSAFSDCETGVDSLTITVESPKYDDFYEVFYDIGNDYNPADSTKRWVNKSDKISEITFDLPFKMIRRLRIDPGTHEGRILIRSIGLKRRFCGIRIHYTWSGEDLKNEFVPMNDITDLTVEDDLLVINSTGSDPYFVYGGEFERFYWISSHLLPIFVAAFVVVTLSALFICLEKVLRLFPNFDKPEAVFVVIATFFGVSMILFTPPFIAPDEPDHFSRSFQVSELKFVPKESEDRITGDYLPEQIQSTPYIALQGMPFISDKKVDVFQNLPLLAKLVDFARRKFVYIFQMSLYSPVPYIPQALGVTLGKLLYPSVLILMYLGRLLNLFTWILLIYLAIRTTPIFKYIFFLVALTPMSLFLAASLSADASTNGLSFLMIALILKYAFGTNDHVKHKDLIILFSISILVSLCKQVYFLLVLLFMMIPVKKLRSNTNYWIIFCSLILLSLTSVLGWTYLVKDLEPVNIYNKENVFPDLQIEYILSHPIEYAKTIARTVLLSRFYTDQFIGLLGWVDVRLPTALICIYAIVLWTVVFLDKSQDTYMTIKNRIILFSVFLIIFCLIMTALYLVWTPVSQGVINGVWGRHFLAISPLLFLTFYTNYGITLNRNFRQSIFSFSITSLSIAVFSIIHRYYVRQDLAQILSYVVLFYAIFNSWKWLFSKDRFNPSLSVVPAAVVTRLFGRKKA
jgi:uncharacterized membrane protein